MMNDLFCQIWSLEKQEAPPATTEVSEDALRRTSLSDRRASTIFGLKDLSFRDSLYEVSPVEKGNPASEQWHFLSDDHSVSPQKHQIQPVITRDQAVQVQIDPNAPHQYDKTDVLRRPRSAPWVRKAENILPAQLSKSISFDICRSVIEQRSVLDEQADDVLPGRGPRATYSALPEQMRREQIELFRNAKKHGTILGLESWGCQLYAAVYNSIYDEAISIQASSRQGLSTHLGRIDVLDVTPEDTVPEAEKHHLRRLDILGGGASELTKSFVARKRIIEEFSEKELKFLEQTLLGGGDLWLHLLYDHPTVLDEGRPGNTLQILKQTFPGYRQPWINKGVDIANAMKDEDGEAVAEEIKEQRIASMKAMAQVTQETGLAAFGDVDNRRVAAKFITLCKYRELSLIDAWRAIRGRRELLNVADETMQAAIAQLYSNDPLTVAHFDKLVGLFPPPST